MLVVFRVALELDPISTTVLLGIERLCRRDGRWSELAEVMQRVFRTICNVHTLGEALEGLRRYPLKDEGGLLYVALEA